MSNPYNILTIDGGGYKGLYVSLLLEKLERNPQWDGARSFHLISGNSTGGIIALALAMGISPGTMAWFYRQHGPKIFQRRRFEKLRGRGIFRSRFDGVALKEGLKRLFEDRVLSDVQTDVVIPAYSLSDDDIFLFRSDFHTFPPYMQDIPVWQVALATSSAPTIFPTCVEVAGHRLCDGGLWSNNPVMTAITDARKRGVSLEAMQVLSLGTADLSRERSRCLDQGGIVQWASHLFGTIQRGQSRGMLHAAGILLGDERRLVRIAPSLPDAFTVPKNFQSASDKMETQAMHDAAVYEKEVADRFALPAVAQDGGRFDESLTIRVEDQQERTPAPSASHP